MRESERDEWVIPRAATAAAPAEAAGVGSLCGGRVLRPARGHLAPRLALCWDRACVLRHTQ